MNFNDIMAQMAANPPDPNEPVPISNRPATMYGATVPFHVLSWVAVLLRLYTRFRVVRDPGFDDYFIILAACFNLVSMVAFIVFIHYGAGKHLLTLDQSAINKIMVWMYIISAAYHTCAVSIKISLLCQYLRLFSAGLLRKTCIILLVLVSFWGAGYCFIAWVPCFPVSGYWNRMSDPPPKCYGLGYGSVDGAKAAFASFAATNMFFDTVIFLIPMAVYFRPGLQKRQIMALLGLFVLGSVVVVMAILRLTTAMDHIVGIEGIDFTWSYPITLIISCIEVDFAIMCASMPIFWPVIIQSWNQIFVTKEVHVTHHQRLEETTVVELEMDRPNSLKSHNSREGLTTAREQPKTDYSDPLIIDHVMGKLTSPVEVEVEVGPKVMKKWRL